jgi:tetratricopeptide (TPR) repeat protein
MTIEQAIALVDEVIYDRTGKHLNDLQARVLREVWQGKKYLEIADLYGCTEGHAKDAGYFLWKILSKAWGEKITKSNFRTATKKHLQLVNYQNSTFLLDSNNEVELNFLGREQAIRDLTTLVDRGHKIIVIQGQGGIGKTTLAKKYLATHFDLVLEFLMAKETQNITSIASLIEEWLKRDFQEEPGQELGVTLARLKRHLEKRKVGVLIDNLEPALDKNGQLITEHRNYIELFRILADPHVKSVTLVTSRDRFCEADINLHHYRLSGLSLEAWTKFFTFNQVPIIDSIIAEMHRIYGGNAKAMGILCGVIKEDFAADFNLYWQENSHDPLTEINLKNLVNNQFNRLQKLDSQAYLLLCRLGCYRYQDIPTVSQAGLLVLLWDLQEANKRRIIESLRHRSLIEFSQGNYWLHPVIKAEALSRLLPKEWQQTNQQIAQFYTEKIAVINSIQDGLTALEAYHHYYAISDFTQAGKVILLSRSNQWGQHLTLGTHLYRLGLIQPLLQAVTQIIARITEPKIYSELNNILGDLYWISGKIKLAIACQQSTIATATNHLDLITNTSHLQQDTYYWKMLQVDSLLSTGLYNIDLWELEAATKVLQQVIDLASNTKHHSWAEKASICLALVYSYLNKQELAAEISNRFIQLIDQEQNQTYNTGRFAYFMQILGQTLINLQKYEQAQTILHQAIAVSQSSHYVQIKAKALTGLAIIQRQNNNFTDAERYYQEAIQILEKIGAKCDLAEAYYQFAIALKQINRVVESKTYLASAVQLFQQIEAPKQILKISQGVDKL